MLSFDYKKRLNLDELNEKILNTTNIDDFENKEYNL